MTSVVPKSIDLLGLYRPLKKAVFGNFRILSYGNSTTYKLTFIKSVFFQRPVKPGIFFALSVRLKSYPVTRLAPGRSTLTLNALAFRLSFSSTSGYEFLPESGPLRWFLDRELRRSAWSNCRAHRIRRCRRCVPADDHFHHRVPHHQFHGW